MSYPPGSSLPPLRDDVAQRIHGLGGGPDWLGRLPETIAHFAERWSLSIAAPFLDLSYAWVAPARRADGTDAVLKLAVPTPELRTEAEALRLFAGEGAVRLLEVDPDAGALLLERLRPGALLADLDDERATEITARAMRRLWRPVPDIHSFPTAERWGLGFERHRARHGGASGPLPARLFSRAETLFGELLASSGERVLLHGDLHHSNVLSAEREPWLVIDPKGVVGEREYEVGAFLRNEFEAAEDPAALQARRLNQFAILLGCDRERLRTWGFAQAVLSACWSDEDHGGGWESAIACAELLDGLAGKR